MERQPGERREAGAEGREPFGAGERGALHARAARRDRLLVPLRFTRVFAGAVGAGPQVRLSSEVVGLVSQLETEQALTEDVLGLLCLIGHARGFVVADIHPQEHSPARCVRQPPQRLEVFWRDGVARPFGRRFFAAGPPRVVDAVATDAEH